MRQLAIAFKSRRTKGGRLFTAVGASAGFRLGNGNGTKARLDGGIDVGVMVGVAVVLLALVARSADADTVYLSDGSQLKGTVETMGHDHLKLDTDFAGTLELDRSKVVGVTTDQSVPVAIGDDEQVAQRLAYDEETGLQKIVEPERRPGASAPPSDEGELPAGYGDGAFGNGVESPSETRQKTLKIDRVVAIRPDQIAEDERLAREKLYTLPEYRSSDRLEEAEWSGEVKFGTNGSAGNSDSTNLTAGISALRNTGLARLNLQASVDRASTGGTETKADYYGAAIYEHDFSRRWYGFIEQDLERDRFQNYGLRTQTLFGPGYFLARERRLIFKVYAGLGYQYTRYYADGGTGNELITTIGWHYGQLLGDYVKLTDDFAIYPQLTDSPMRNFSFKNVLAATVPIADSPFWAISAQVESDYDNQPRQPDTNRLNTKYSVVLQRSF